MQAYREMIHSIVVPATLSHEEMLKRYQPFTDFLQVETPENLYRFRRCDERSIDAFDQDQLWFAPSYKMNDDFDALLYFDKERIKSGLKMFIDSDQVQAALQIFSQGGEVPASIQNLFSSEFVDTIRKNIVQMDHSAMNLAINQFYAFFTRQVDINNIVVQQLVQKSIKFACFSTEIGSAAMWGYYADSGCGFALSYDFRNGDYTTCNTCTNGNQCSFYKNCFLAPVIYEDSRFDATEYATWLFQQEAIQKILTNQNALSLYSIFQNMVPCPDLFMPTKILLHKANAWSHEQEWRLTCQCNSPDFNQQEFSWAKKRPTAVYLGRKISPIYEKILRHIAIEKNIPVYKMQIQWNDSSYKLYPEKML